MSDITEKYENNKPEDKTITIEEIDEICNKLNLQQCKYMIKQLFKKTNINRIRCHTHAYKLPIIDLGNIYVINVVSQIKRMFYDNINNNSINVFKPLINIYNKSYSKTCNYMCKDCIVDFAANNSIQCNHSAFTEINNCNVCQRVVLNCFSCRNVIFKCELCNIRCCRYCVLENYIVNNTDIICKECTFNIMVEYFEPEMEKIMIKYRNQYSASI